MLASVVVVVVVVVFLDSKRLSCYFLWKRLQECAAVVDEK